MDSPEMKLKTCGVGSGSGAVRGAGRVGLTGSGTWRRRGRCLSRGRRSLHQPENRIEVRGALGVFLKVAELRKLRHELGAARRIVRILVLQLRHQQLHEDILVRETAG